MKRSLAILACLWGLTGTAAADPDAAMDRYLAIWADNARVTAATVEHLYAGHVVYYGQRMTPGQVYRDKLAYIRQWPDRRYAVVPGSVGKTCDAAASTCRISAILSWEKAGSLGHAGGRGANTLVLILVREGGTLKIARESGSPVAQSACRAIGGRWTCSAYR